MNIDRRDFLKSGVAFSTMAMLPSMVEAAPTNAFAPQPDSWRNFEITTRIDIPGAQGPLRSWVPLPTITSTDWIRPLGDTWTFGSGSATVHQADGARMLSIAWPKGTASATVEVKSRVATRNRAVDWTRPGTPTPLSAVERQHFTAATPLVPTDGIVRETAMSITVGAASDVAKAHRIYEWMVTNTFRDANTRGCGTGDVVAMLSSGKLGGKCADLNALFVGLARASGIPARELYGIRVAPSQFGYKSLGANSIDITSAQHCRAEVYLSSFGWVPMDPADVRKVMLEESPGNLPLDDARVEAVRRTLFGAWETNWIAYNDARDVVLPGSDGPVLGFLMYPQAETVAGRLDCLQPNAFKYAISTREIML